jgi:two-component system, chemotaxis family, CheB/CheR fusion protein
VGGLRQNPARRKVSQEDTKFVIAALGASAGGLEALEGFFRHMPADAGIGFVVVQHLAPDHASVLAELLARCTSMTVEQARERAKVAPNRVYIIPPNATLTVKDGTLRVAPPAEPRGYRMPIDSLFCSLAEDCAEHAVCIMLSGTGTDGTLGLRAIKEYGGMAMAQTLESAKYDAILRSAISTGLVDHVLPVEEMPAKLVDYAVHLSSTNGKAIREQFDGTHLDRIHNLLRRRAGHDFSQYKESTVLRRLERRMKALQIETVDGYLHVMEQQPEEADRLFKDLLIGVTQFFRDADAFTTIGREVIPKLFAGKEADRQVRACVVGCASGEEAYSIAILLCEFAASMDSPPQLKVFATDIDERGLEMARKGRYPESIAEHLSADRLARYFIKQEGAYQVKRELREICLFTNHSFIKDPPFSRLDLISCRNVMIYLGADLQQKMIPLFHYALRPGGYLFLGPSEGISSHPDLFRTVDKKHRIFQKKETIQRPAITLPLADTGAPSFSGGKQRATEGLTVPKQLERIILQRYGPACAVVRENGDAIYFSGEIGSYLQPASGTPDNNVINMAREGLRVPLRTALHKAVSGHERVIQKDVSVRKNGGVSLVDLTVEPISEFADDGLFMILFEDAVTPPAGVTPPAAFDASSADTVRHLEGELRAAQERAQSMFEELESANEELKSANEKYQSTNEELETSKEEVQSSNEELETINAELNRRLAELDHANGDLQNLINSTQIATIFLDTELHIRSFTSAAGGVFRLIAGDIGRPITDLAAQFADDHLIDDIREVLQTLVPRDRDLPGTRGRHFLTRVLPYRTVHDVIDGVVVTFTDVTELKQAEQRAHDARIYAESIVDAVREPLLVLDAGLRVQLANTSFYRTFGVAPERTLRRSLFELGDRQWDIPELRRLLDGVLPEKKKMDDFAVELDLPATGPSTMLLNAREIPQQNGAARLILLALEDVTERKRVEQGRLELQAKELTMASERALREKETELARVARTLTIGELATSIAHEINQPLAGVVTNAEAGLRWLVADPPEIHEAQESLRLIVRDGNRASAVIRRVREFVKKETHETTAVDIKEAIHETVALAQAELLANQVTVSLNLSDRIPYVRADRVLLQQVILNLITNACEAMATVTDRPREMVVSVQGTVEGAVLVSVRDSGVGIEPEHIDKICNAFFTTKPMGMGMGLSISHSIIEAHGGRLWAVPNEGPGLTVQFTLSAANENRS